MGNYRLLRTIGKGNFAKVKLARHILTGREVSLQHLRLVGGGARWAWPAFSSVTSGESLPLRRTDQIISGFSRAARVGEGNPFQASLRWSEIADHGQSCVVFLIIGVAFVSALIVDLDSSRSSSDLENTRFIGVLEYTLSLPPPTPRVWQHYCRKGPADGEPRYEASNSHSTGEKVVGGFLTPPHRLPL